MVSAEAIPQRVLGRLAHGGGYVSATVGAVAGREAKISPHCHRTASLSSPIVSSISDPGLYV